MIKTAYTVGNKEVQAYIPKEPTASNLEELYNVLNNLFADYSECFYTSDEVKKLKKDPTNTFLRGAKR